MAMKIPAWLTALACAALLTSCGGGGPDPVAAMAPAPQAAQASAAAATLTADAMFDWAPTAYPQYFRGSYSAGTAPYQGRTYQYRYYALTSTYLAVSDGGIYVLGPWTGSQLLSVGALQSFACTVDPVSCGGSAPSALALAQTLLAAYDQMWATPPANGTALLSFTDACWQNDGETRSWAIANFDGDPDKGQKDQAYRVGSTRTNIAVVAERNTTNADHSARREIDVTYTVNYADGSTAPSTETLIAGSSSGSCAAPDNLTSLRFLGNRRLVGVNVRNRVIRDQRYLLSNGSADATTSLTYRRDVEWGVYDPQGNATYAIVSGPGPAVSVNGVTTTFSMKLISPRLLQSAPELAGKANNYLNWLYSDFFRTCKAPAAAVGSGVPVAGAADCTGLGAQGPSWGVTLNNPTPSNAAASDANFANLGFVAGGTYTFAVYNDDGWKTVNGQAGKTPIATYTEKLDALPNTFVRMVGTGSAADLFPRITATTLFPPQLAAAVLSGVGSSVGMNWVVPGSQTDGRIFRLLQAYEYFEGPAKTNTGGAAFPAYRYQNDVRPFGTATAATASVTGTPSTISAKNYAEFGVNYTDRNNGRITSLMTFR
jgi:hypothetical protein